MRFFSTADIRNPLRYLFMNAVALRSVSGSFQLPLTEASPSSAAQCSAHLKRGNAYLRSKKSTLLPKVIQEWIFLFYIRFNLF